MMVEKLAEGGSLVRSVFQGVLKRNPDTLELTYWTEALASGFTPSDFVSAVVSCEEAISAPPVKLFCPPGHFYSPIVNPYEAKRHFAATEAKAIPEKVPGIILDRHKMSRLWQELLPFLRAAPFRETPFSDFHYGYDNENYSWGDGSILHAMIVRHQPRRIIEIGSGWSSMCTLDTIEKDYADQKCALTVIEPYPNLLLDLASDKAAAIRIIELGVQNVPLGTFDELQQDDVLFIDSTHVLSTGSDVCFELFEILPRLASGVLVHFHDIFWPFEYPRHWVIEENRSWNEVYGVRAYLTNNADWEIVFFNDFFAKFERELIESTWPLFLKNTGGALWLRRR